MPSMSRIRRFDHLGITVADLDAVSGFFVQLGLEVEGRTFLEGDFLDTVIGIPDARTEIVLLRAPNGGTGLELARFIRPDHEPGSPAAMATELGLRSVAFEVDDLQAIVDRTVCLAPWDQTCWSTCGRHGLCSCESQTSSGSSARTSRWPWVRGSLSSPKKTAMSPPMTAGRPPVSTTTTCEPRVWPGAGTTRSPGSNSSAPSTGTYCTPGASTQSRIV